MRDQLCIGMILRSDESLGPAPTLRTMLALGSVLQGIGVAWSFIPVKGFSHSRGRNILLSTYLHIAPPECSDLLWLDYGNAMPGGQDFNVVEAFVRTMLTSEADVVCFPSPLRGGQDHQYPYNCFPPPGKPRLYHERIVGIPGVENWCLQELEGCGFGMVRMRRSAAEKVHAWCRDPKSPDFTGRPVYQSDFGPIPGAAVFSEYVDGDQELGEDVAFCRRARKAGVKLYAAVDFPVDHGDRIPGQTFPLYRETMGLGSLEDPGAANDGPKILGPDGRAMVH